MSSTSYYSEIEFETELHVRACQKQFRYRMVTPPEIDDIDLLIEQHWKAMKSLKNGKVIFLHQVYVSELASLLNVTLPNVDIAVCVNQYLGSDAANININVKSFDKDKLSIDFLCLTKINGKYFFSTIESNGSGHKTKKANSQQVVQDSVKAYYLNMLGAKQFIVPDGILDANAQSKQSMIRSIISDCISF